MSSVRPSFFTFSVLLIVYPLAFVLGTVSMSVLTKSMSFVVFPVTVIDVAIGVDKSTSAIGHVPLPVALINRAIRPNLDTPSVSLICVDVPLSGVLGAIRQSLSVSVFEPYSVVNVLLLFVKSILEWRQ